METHIDPRLLRVVLENLIGNARKFTSKTEYPRIETGSMRDGHHADFFRDNGAGFDMTCAGKPFGAFQRLHPANEFCRHGHWTGYGTTNYQQAWWANPRRSSA